jgi:RNA polymerase sigma factor (sigma-70 family)
VREDPAEGGVRGADEQRPTVAMPPMTREQLEAFYATEYPKLVKILVLLDATIEEAEDAAQKAMTDFAKRSKAGQAPDHPASYVRTAAVRFFIKERQRGRERLRRELRGGHLVLEAHLDDRLTILEDEQYIEHLLECLTWTQRQVIRLVMDGLSTHEIAEELGKSDESIRQHLKNGRDRLKLHPEIAPLAPRHSQDPMQQGVRSTGTTPEPRREEVQ